MLGGFQRAAKARQSFHTFFDDLITRGIAESEITLRTECAPWYRSNLFRVQQAIAELEIRETKARDIGKQIKGALRQETRHAWNFIELTVQQLSPPIECGQHDLQRR